jgi:LysM repeat protein
MTSINGFLVSDSRAAIGVKSYTVPGTTTVLPVRSDIAPLLIGAAQEYNTYVEKLVKGHCWGYAYRPVRGGSTPSFHAAAIAIDLNAPEHPMGTAPTANYSAAEIAQCRRIAKKYGLRWGGDYTGRKDGMHFEVILTRTAALALVKKLQAPVAAVSYTVVRGDTLGGIAAKHHITLAAILKLNPSIKNPNVISVGQKIRVK